MMFNKKSQLLGVCKKSLPLAIALALTACGGSSSETDQSVGALKIGTHPVFDPLAGSLPLNTDLLFAAAASSDGTANVGVPTNPAEAAINALDGFSTSAYFDIAFAGGSIDAGTVVACQLAMLGTGACAQANVFVLALDTGGNDALDPANIVGVDAANLPAFEASVVSLDGGTDNTLRIAPLEPLKAKTKYLVFVTNGLKDTSGQPITPSGSYHVLGENVPDLTPALQPVRGAVQGWESIAAAFLNSASGGAISLEQARDSVAVSYTFTTTDPIAPLVAMAAPRAALVEAQKSFGASDEEALLGLQGILGSGVQLSTPQARDFGMVTAVPDGVGGFIDVGADLNDFSAALAANVARAYVGYIRLPYYLASPDTSPGGDFTQDAWTADQQLGAVLSAGLPEGEAAVPRADLDGSFNVTYRYPFAQQRGDESVPLQVTLPVSEACAEAESWPVAVYAHGIGSNRTSVAAVAHTLASTCVATVAVDLPLHGVNGGNPGNVETDAQISGLLAQLYEDNAPRERHFNTPSGSAFINLANLPNTRDNLRQAVMDILNLNATLPQLDAALQAQGKPALDLENASLLGVSLGGIVGSVAATVNQLAIGADGLLAQAAQNPELASKLVSWSSLTVSTGGSQVTQILLNSERLGQDVSDGLAAAGVLPETQNFERFAYVAQSTVDSGDPVNFARILAGNTPYGEQLAAAGLTVPVLVQQVNGDKVVPNMAEGAPLAGTSPLAALFGANAVESGDPATPKQPNALVRLGIGHHGSLLRPNEEDGEMPTVLELLATRELQTQLASFILSGGAAISVGTAGDGAADAFID